MTFSSEGTQNLPAVVWPFILAMGVFHIISHRIKLGEMLAQIPPARFALATGALAALALSFVPLGYRPFIYFQF